MVTGDRVRSSDRDSTSLFTADPWKPRTRFIRELKPSSRRCIRVLVLSWRRKSTSHFSVLIMNSPNPHDSDIDMSDSGKSAELRKRDRN